MSPAQVLLRAQRAAGKTLTQIAAEIGYSRTAVSLYQGGKYDRDAARLEAAIVRAYDRRVCPHLGESVEPELCVRKALAPKPFGGSARLTWWMRCQGCAHRPEES
ncbi:hypothetical protein SAMN05421829_108132 [Aromatoleum tolulyticum]|uniref:Helix-turn-helix n=1 Tax=Aromatoleum tolulyticum TaxID=34027 RepID=A0A1N6WZD3_9RHOO|nr:helix-turn-helix transcriptional regulator [Aromatoleum tolulyticum]SIQ95427.1 hypothetical protein SAMN05421829_108132 [Aromatoleum tolulyticum]